MKKKFNPRIKARLRKNRQVLSKNIDNFFGWVKGAKLVELKECSIELILLAVNINLVAFSIYLGDLAGQVFTLFILTVAAAEASIGLAIIVVYFRNSGTIRVEEIDKLKG